MLFNTEIENLLDCAANNALEADEVEIAIEHYDLGGFHSNVTQENKAAFKAWLESDQGEFA